MKFKILLLILISFYFTQTNVFSQSVWLSSYSVTQGQTVYTYWNGFSGNVNVAVYKGSSFWVYSVVNQPGSSGAQDLDTSGWEVRNDYTIRVELSSNTSFYREAGPLAVNSVVQTNLVAVKAYITLLGDPANELTRDPVVGEQIQFGLNYEVENAAVTGSFIIRCFLDNQLQWEDTRSNYPVGYYYLDPTIVGITWTATAGSHSLKWLIDANNQISESNETDNEATRGWNTPQQFDLNAGIVELKDASGNNIQGYIGEQVYFHFNYSVSGSGTTPSFKIRCNLDGSTYYTSSYLTRTGGQSYSINAPNPWTATSGSHTIEWVLDIDNNIAESNENNNSTSTGYTPQERPPGPQLVFPDDGAYITDTTPDFSWNYSGDVNYFHIQIDNNSDFSSPEKENSQCWDPWWTPSAMNLGTYNWRVRSHGTNGQWSAWSSVWSLTIQTAPVLTLINPPENSTVTTNEITFQWSDVGAESYELLVDNNSSFNSSEISADQIPELVNFTGTEYTISGNWLSQNDYSWKVIAHFTDGSTSESAVSTFTYQPPTSSYPVWLPLYRMYNSGDNDHFYSLNDNHRQIALNSNYKTERVDGYLSVQRFNAPDLVSVFRFYDGARKYHYYTTDETDKDNQIINGLTYEGITGFAYGTSHEGLVKLYHLKKIYDASNHDHFYTTSKFERDNAIQAFGFTDEGILTNVSQTGDNTFIPFHKAHIEAGSGMNPVNGNFRYYTKSSFNIPSIGLPIFFEHIYNSTSVMLQSTLLPLGPGWSHSYHSYIDLAYGDTVAVVWPDGSIDLYNKNGSIYTPVYKFVNDELTEISSTRFEIKKKDQTVYVYEILPGAPAEYPAVLKYIKDRNNNTITCGYETSGLRRLTSVTGPAGRLLTITYHSTPGKKYLIQQVQDPIGRTIQFDYDNDGILNKFTDAEGRDTIYIYDTISAYGHMLKQIQLPRGNIIDNTYNQKKIESQLIRGAGNVQFKYSGNQTTITTSQTQIDVFKNTLGGFEYIDKIQDKLGNSIDPDNLDANNPSKPTQVKDQNGNITNYIYDTRGNVLEIHRPLGVTEKFEYDSQNNLTKYTDPRNNVTIFTYDANGNLISMSDPLSHEMNMSRNTNGLIQSITNPNSHTWNFGYDQFGNVTSIQDPLFYTTNLSYDNASRMTQIINANNQTTTNTYTNTDLIKTIIDAMNGVTTYHYDANDNLESIDDPKGQTTTWGYNNQDLLTSISNPLGNQKSFSYNDDGSLSSRTNPDGEQTSYTYDQAARLSTISSSSISATFGYDANGNITSINDNNGSMSFTYDALDRLTSQRDYYNNTVIYGYDAASNITSITYKSGKTVTYTYYNDNRLESVTDWNSKTTTYTYYPDGSLQQVTYPNGCYTTYEYDLAERLTNIYNRKSSGEIIASYSYQLDALGNHTNQTYTEPFGMPSYVPKNISLTYNAANRIIIAGANNYAFDPNGNLTGKSGAENLTFGYDSENRLTSMSGDHSASYVYDIFGNRRQATRNGTTLRYVLDISGPMSQVLMETDVNNNPTSYFIYGIGLIYRIKSDGTYHYYHYNNVGNTIAMTDQAQNLTHKYAYKPYGKVLSKVEADDNPFKFVGQYGVMDEGNDLYFMRARFYDAEIGRFVSEDPIWDVNLYGYANSNPMINFDPTGNYWLKYNSFLYKVTKFVDNPKVLLSAKIGKVVFSNVAKLTPWGAAISTSINMMPIMVKMMKGELTSKEAIQEAVKLSIDLAAGNLSDKISYKARGIDFLHTKSWANSRMFVTRGVKRGLEAFFDIDEIYQAIEEYRK